MKADLEALEVCPRCGRVGACAEPATCGGERRQIAHCAEASDLAERRKRARQRAEVPNPVPPDAA